MDWRLFVGLACLYFAFHAPKSDVSIEWPDFLSFLNKPAVTVVIPTPPSDLNGLVTAVKAASTTVTPEDKMALSHFYSDFATVLSVDDSLVTDTVRFRSAYSLAGKTLFNSKLKGKYPGLGAAIDAQIMTAIGDNATKLDRTKAVNVMNAIAYAFGG